MLINSTFEISIIYMSRSSSLLPSKLEYKWLVLKVILRRVKFYLGYVKLKYKIYKKIAGYIE